MEREIQMMDNDMRDRLLSRFDTCLVSLEDSLKILGDTDVFLSGYIEDTIENIKELRGLIEKPNIVDVNTLTDEEALARLLGETLDEEPKKTDVIEASDKEEKTSNKEEIAYQIPVDFMKSSEYGSVKL